MKGLLRHSRKGLLRHFYEDANPSPHYHKARKNTPSFPRRRESIAPLSQCPKKYSVIPAKAGIHNSRLRGNLTKTPSRLTNTLHSHARFPHRRKSTPSVISTKTRIGNIEDGLHCVNSRMRGNDEVLLWRTRTATRIFHPSVDFVPGWRQ